MKTASLQLTKEQIIAELEPELNKIQGHAPGELKRMLEGALNFTGPNSITLCFVVSTIAEKYHETFDKDGMMDDKIPNLLAKLCKLHFNDVEV